MLGQVPIDFGPMTQIKSDRARLINQLKEEIARYEAARSGQASRAS